MQTPRNLTLVLSLAASLAIFTGCDRPQSRDDDAPSASESTAEAVSPGDGSTERDALSGAARPPGEADDTPQITALWAGENVDGILHVELTGLDIGETKQVSALFEEDKSDDDTLAYSAANMPPRFHDIEALDVLTPDGPIRTEIAQFVRTRGPSSHHYWLHTKPSEQLTDRLTTRAGSTLDWTLATPAGEMSDTATMRLAEPKPVHAKAAPKLRQAFLGALEPNERKRVAPELADEHIVAASARFPSPHAQMVTVNIPSKHRTPLAQAAFVADGTGEVTYTAKAPFVGPLGNITLLAVADPDGDATDGVLYRMDTDGYFIFWLHFDDDGKVVVDTLSGFSA